MNKTGKVATINNGKNYWCTWATQWALGKTRAANEGSEAGYFEGDSLAGKYARYEMTEDRIFGKDGFAEQFPEFRNDLYLLIDDGWDVPVNVSTETDTSDFGSVIVNSDRFPSFGGTPAERLKRFNDELRKLGWLGLGIWISPQMCNEGYKIKYEENSELHKAYWKERVLWCKYAGIRYWKVDWGNHGGADTVEYRRMLSDLAKEFYPELIIEHSVGIPPINGFPATDKIRYADNKDWVRKNIALCSFSDVFRSYDITEDMMGDTTTLDRLSFLLSFSPCLINCEDALYIGATLGCSLGIMRSHYGNNWLRMNNKLDEIAAALNWQKYAPSFVGGELKISEDILIDRVFFGSKDTWYRELHNKVIEQAAPAVMARNTELPMVERSQKMPYVIASMNPTGVYSLAAIKRREYLFDTEPPVVECSLGMVERIGVFGDFKKIKFNLSSSPKKIHAQSLIRGKEICLETENVTQDNSVIITEDLLKSLNTVDDKSDNAVAFRFEF